jgi:hypothetical protein
MLAAAAYNFKKLMRQLLDYVPLFFQAVEFQVIGLIPLGRAS